MLDLATRPRRIPPIARRVHMHTIVAIVHRQPEINLVDRMRCWVCDGGIPRGIAPYDGRALCPPCMAVRIYFERTR